MPKIPKQKPIEKSRIESIDKENLLTNKNVIFSFDTLKTNEYFNLDGTCSNWSIELFGMLKEVSNIEAKRIFAGEFSRDGSTLRIHDHKKASPPCRLPEGIELDEFWQIRISKSKGGIHGIFVDNVFYVIWLDPLHNMYPDDKYGGLKKIKPPSTCCRERENEITVLKNKITSLEEECKVWEEIASAKERN